MHQSNLDETSINWIKNTNWTYKTRMRTTKDAEIATRKRLKILTEKIVQ